MKKLAKKVRPCVLVSAAVVAVLVIGCCSSRDRAHPSRSRTVPYGARVKLPPRSEPYGTWVNPSSESFGTKSSKIIYNPDGTWVSFDCLRSSVPYHRGTISIWDHWKDRRGNRWYKVTTNQVGIKVFVYELWRIDRKGFVLEGVWNCAAMPSCIDTGDPSYTIYYRHGSAVKEPPIVAPSTPKQKEKTTV
jgi:hypothetical protein